MTDIHVIEVAAGEWSVSQDQIKVEGTDILNNATTSSVLTKLSISGCICLSMYNRLSGKIDMGPGEE